MREVVTLARRSYSMWRSDDPRESVVASILAIVAVGLVLYQFRGRRS